eukprot:Nk52_evm7s289 gene=Nk52_evmTU7s289
MRGVEEFRVVPVLLVLLICLHVGVSALPQTAASSGNSSEGEIFEELAVTGKNNSTGDIATKAFEFYSKVTSFLYSCLWIKMKDLMAKGELFAPQSRGRRGNILIWYRRHWGSPEQKEAIKTQDFNKALRKATEDMVKDLKTLQKSSVLSDSLKNLIPEDLHLKFTRALAEKKEGTGSASDDKAGLQLFLDEFAKYLTEIVDIRSKFISDWRADARGFPDSYILKFMKGVPDNQFQEFLNDNDDLKDFQEAYNAKVAPKIEAMQGQFESLLQPLDLVEKEYMQSYLSGSVQDIDDLNSMVGQEGLQSVQDIDDVDRSQAADPNSGAPQLDDGGDGSRSGGGDDNGGVEGANEGAPWLNNGGDGREGTGEAGKDNEPAVPESGFP